MHICYSPGLRVGINCAREYGPRPQTEGTVCPNTDQQGPGLATSHITKPPGFVGKIEKFCPLPESIRLRNLQNSAPSRKEKKNVSISATDAIRLFCILRTNTHLGTFIRF